MAKRKVQLEQQPEPAAGMDKFIVRLPNGRRDDLKAAAASNNRSMNAEIVARLEESFREGNAALLEAVQIAESLRNNLTRKLENYDRSLTALQRREEALTEAEEKLSAREFELERSIEERVAERRKELEDEFAALTDYVEKRRKEADDYADFTIAREKQFYEAIKKITGVEPPPVDEEAARIRQARFDRKERE